MKLERELKIDAAYDKRAEGYGQHCVTMSWYVKGPKGVIQFVLYTGWYPHCVAKPTADWEELAHRPRLEPHEAPLPADIGYHSHEPIYEGQTELTDKCPLLDGARCYYDGSSLNATRYFSILVHEGDQALWKALEQQYVDRFGADAAVTREREAEAVETGDRG